MVVSRWFVMPMAAMSSADAPTSFMADSATPSWVVQISLASCSTQPGLGKYWVNSFCATLHISPRALKRMQRLDVVPASSAMIYFCFVIAVSPFTAENRSVSLLYRMFRFYARGKTAKFFTLFLAGLALDGAGTAYLMVRRCPRISSYKLV